MNVIINEKTNVIDQKELKPLATFLYKTRLYMVVEFCQALTVEPNAPESIVCYAVDLNNTGTVVIFRQGNLGEMKLVRQTANAIFEEI